MKTIDLNCDLGEGMDNDAHIMSYISSCNIACGGHYGNQESVAGALQLALKHNVKVGAHPSFEDRENFGRVFMDISRSRFRESITQQIQLFQNVALQIGVEMHHIKMHGALYHATAYREDFSDWLIELVKEFYPSSLLFVPPHSMLEKKCKANHVKHWKEGFADRAYDSDGKLVSRNVSGSLITDFQGVVCQIEQLVKERKVTSIDGKVTSLIADTICIHGDNLQLTKNLQSLTEELKKRELYVA